MNRFIVALFALTCAGLGLAAEKPTEWRSETHLGFALHDQSTTHFEDASGSLAFLDITRTMSDSVHLGMRTTMMGAEHRRRSFYRLGAGPVLSWEWMEHWSLVTSLGYFRESASTADKQDLYESRGWMATLGWQRIIPITPRAAFIWGAFVALHDGSASNKGRARGAEIALRVAL